ncbi:hypothetical protein JRQ81_019797 [Phrynocephalus forsythii]|uniref:Immunoglobulin V-set domain-containing protein n=1 Tax=Phrynocephalus forsythii TaxID=171643 RepID=A0A9Q1AYV6_9SAUR|nr:hypothetical protein JRQ81_019797 [Phrynocephalus forsythii]
MIGNLSEGDASLTIVNVTTSDHGTYFCQVILPTGEVVTGDGTKLRIQRAMGFFGIEESIGTIIGVLAASIGGLVVLIIVLVPHLKKCRPCAKRTSHEGLEKTQCSEVAIFIQLAELCTNYSTEETNVMNMKLKLCIFLFQKIHIPFNAIYSYNYIQDKNDHKENLARRHSVG